MTAILATGAYVPRLRLQRAAVVAATRWFNPALAALGQGERAMASWDEDAITMAVEAARDCMMGYDRSQLTRVVLASTSLPFADRLNTGVVKEALGLPDSISALDITGSQRAGTSALLAAFEAGAKGPVLCLAADKRLARAASNADLVNGDASAALLVGPGQGIARLIASHSVTVDFIDRYRAAGADYDYEWEPRWVRDEGYPEIHRAVAQALRKAGIEPARVNHFALGLPIAGAARAVAARIGFASKALITPLDEDLGYAGAAHPLLLLERALRRAGPDETIIVASFGQGIDVLVLRTTAKISAPRPSMGIERWLARRTSEENYLKFLYFTDRVAFDEGMRAELDLKTPPSMLYRDRRTVMALVGGKCRETGAVQYPRTAISAAPQERRTDTQDDHPLADLTARLVSFTADHLAYSPDPPSCYGMIDFAGGGRMLADIADNDGELAVGAAMRMMFRVKRRDRRGFVHYYWKAVPDYRLQLEVT